MIPCFLHTVLSALLNTRGRLLTGFRLDTSHTTKSGRVLMSTVSILRTKRLGDDALQPPHSISCSGPFSVIANAKPRGVNANPAIRTTTVGPPIGWCIRPQGGPAERGFAASGRSSPLACQSCFQGVHELVLVLVLAHTHIRRQTVPEVAHQGPPQRRRAYAARAVGRPSRIGQWRSHPQDPREGPTRSGTNRTSLDALICNCLMIRKASLHQHSERLASRHDVLFCRCGYVYSQSVNN